MNCTLLLFAPIFIFMLETPLSVALSLIMLSGLIGISSWLMSSKWVGLSIVLIYIGGMMVVFLYVTFLSVNFKFKSLKKNPLLLILSLLIWGLSFSPSYSFCPDFLATQFFSSSNSQSLIFLIIYLLLILLVVVKIVENFKGALIKKF